MFDDFLSSEESAPAVPKRPNESIPSQESNLIMNLVEVKDNNFMDIPIKPSEPDPEVIKKEEEATSSLVEVSFTIEDEDEQTQTQEQKSCDE